MRKSKYGWIRDLPDHRDHVYQLQIPVEVIPQKIDLSQLFPPVYNQGDLGSCFIGSTKIPLLNGNIRTLEELSHGIEGDKFWVYSINENNKIVPAIATASKTGINKKIIRINLDNNNFVDCTPEHKFMLRDGSYVEAQYLTSGQSLMPLKRKLSDKGYELIFDNDEYKWHYTHWIVKTFFKNRPGHDLIHHKDFNKKNNAPDNLEYMGWIEHRDLHAKLCEINFKNWNGSKEQIEHSRRVAIKMHLENPGWHLEGVSKGGKTAWKNASPDKQKEILEMLKKNSIDPVNREKARQSIIKTLSAPEAKLKSSENSKKQMNIHKENNDDFWKSLIEVGKKLGKESLKYQIMKLGKEMLDNKIIINIETWNQYRNKFSEKRTIHRIRNENKQTYIGVSNGTPRFETAIKTFGDIETLVDACSNYNCKVDNIEIINKCEDVYCLTVDKYHNFALDCGIFVHNCTANSIAGAFEYGLKKQGYADFLPSRLFIYYNERVMENTVKSDSGAQLRDGIKSINSKGVCTETLWPYDITKFAKKPLAKCYTDALKHHALSYQSVSQTLIGLRGCLATNIPVVFGFAVYESFESNEVATTGIVNMPKKSESLLGGHAVVIVGYDDTIQRFVVRNSWGDKWGNKGYFTMPYEYITNQKLASDFWAIKIVEGTTVKEMLKNGRK